LNTGGSYNATSNTWTPVTTSGAPAARYQQVAVWTGSEMVLWGGATGAIYYNDGGRYNPAANTWTSILGTLSNTPAGRRIHSGVWTGSELIVWGGWNGGPLSSGGRYTPANNTWAALPTVSAPLPRYSHTAIWTGTEMIVWGGVSDVFHGDGARYIRSSDT
jgi:N-acetylneuraminic acid mutarotase